MIEGAETDVSSLMHTKGSLIGYPYDLGGPASQDLSTKRSQYHFLYFRCPLHCPSRIKLHRSPFRSRTLSQPRRLGRTGYFGEVPSDPCGSPAERLYSRYDPQECSIYGAGWNDPCNDPAGGGIHRRRSRRCAGFDSGNEIVDILHLCLCWSECSGVSIRFSQSSVLSAVTTLS
jgi:hypothetical protein